MFIDYNGSAIEDGAVVLNGQWQGRLGEQIQGVRYDPGYLRPYFDSHGERCVTVNTGKMKYDSKTRTYFPEKKKIRIADLMNRGIYNPIWNATTLRKDEWIMFDNAVVRVFRQRVRAWADLAAANSFGGFNGMAKMSLEYEAQSDPGFAIEDMDGITDAHTNDTPLFRLRSLPLPITHSDFFFSERQLAVSRNTGTPLDVTMAEAAARRIAERIENVTIGTVTGISYGGVTTGPHPHDTSGGMGASQVYGYTNFPHRITKTDLTTPTGSNPEAVMTDVLEMVELLQSAGFYGPYMLYHSTPYSRYLSDDYFRTGSTSAVRSLRQRILEIEGIEDVRRLDYLTSGYQLILVQMTSEVARAVIGMELTTIMWESKGGMQKNFKVMTIKVPNIRSDYNGNAGIVHGTTA